MRETSPRGAPEWRGVIICPRVPDMEARPVGVLTQLISARPSRQLIKWRHQGEGDWKGQVPHCCSRDCKSSFRKRSPFHLCAYLLPWSRELRGQTCGTKAARQHRMNNVLQMTLITVNKLFCLLWTVQNTDSGTSAGRSIMVQGQNRDVMIVLK